MSYSKDGKYVYFKHGEEHDLALTEMYKTETSRNGVVRDRLGTYIAKHIAQGQVYPCTGNKDTCEGCQKGADRISAFKQVVKDYSNGADGTELYFEMPIKLMQALIERQKMLKDMGHSDEEVLTAVYRIRKNAKWSDPLWNVSVVRKPVPVEIVKPVAPAAVDLNGDGEGGEPITFTREELDMVAKYNSKLKNALSANPDIDVAASLRKSLADINGWPEAKVGAVLAAIGDDKLVDLQSLKMA